MRNLAHAMLVFVLLALGAWAEDTAKAAPPVPTSAKAEVPEAVRELLEVTKQAPDDVAAREALAKAIKDIRDADSRLVSHQARIEIAPTQANYEALIADHERIKKHRRAVLTAYQGMWRAYPESHHAHASAYAIMLCRHGAGNVGAHLLRDYLTRTGEVPPGYALACEMLFRAQRKKDAIAAAEQGLALLAKGGRRNGLELQLAGYLLKQNEQGRSEQAALAILRSDAEFAVRNKALTFLTKHFADSANLRSALLELVEVTSSASELELLARAFHRLGWHSEHVKARRRQLDVEPHKAHFAKLVSALKTAQDWPGMLDAATRYAKAYPDDGIRNWRQILAYLQAQEQRPSCVTGVESLMSAYPTDGAVLGLETLTAVAAFERGEALYKNVSAAVAGGELRWRLDSAMVDLLIASKQPERARVLLKTLHQDGNSRAQVFRIRKLQRRLDEIANAEPLAKP